MVKVKYAIKKLVSSIYNEPMIGSCFIVLGENKHLILMIHVMMDINERHEQLFTLKLNIHATDKNGRDSYSIGVDALVFLALFKQFSFFNHIFFIANCICNLMHLMVN